MAGQEGMKGFQSCSVLNWLAHTPPIVLLFSPQYCGLEGYSTKEILQKVLDFDSVKIKVQSLHIVSLQKVQRLGQGDAVENIYNPLLFCCPAIWITSWLGRSLIFNFLFYTALIRSFAFNF